MLRLLILKCILPICRVAVSEASVTGTLLLKQSTNKLELVKTENI